MNMVEANLSRSNGALFVEFAGLRLRVDDRAVQARSLLPRFEGRKVVLGLRPESMQDATLASGAPDDRRISVIVELREALGSQIMIHFAVDAPPVLTEQTKELAHDVGMEVAAGLHRSAEKAQSTFVAQLDPKSTVREGERIELVLDTSRFHFFDPETGLGIYGE